MSTASYDVPARGTRPRNRRQMIVKAAAGLFAEQGFPHVSMSDIAGAVAVGPSALYRHFPGKQELLVEVMVTRVASFASHVADAARDNDPLRALAEAALEHRDFGALWERESRHLDPSALREINQSVLGVLASLEAILKTQQPGLSAPAAELRTWTTIGVLMSPSFHHIELPGTGLRDLLAEMAGAAIRTPPTSDLATGPDRVAQVGGQSRREQLLASAIALFAERGYQSVGIEDIAAEAGLTGTSIYRHFEAKNDLLVAAMTRGAEWLRLDLNRALSRASTPDSALSELVASYAGLVLDQPDLISVMLSETGNLPDGDLRRIVKEQRGYIGEWIHLMADVHPDEPEDIARVRVQAALSVTTTCARNARLRKLPSLAAELQAAGAAVLGLPA
ncbi:TetR/AcrR family transcriptional regulator [Nocardioides sp. WS12]|uniref:TetR/AcrR family transcriptional regulator n=1 Tax=Nocardioides sp. WS12 TaxID=2486272 RepID=UPI0015F7EF63|nr:TetR/AcrR family transcriptional regulator [Nocardioides sp. WS12]